MVGECGFSRQAESSCQIWEGLLGRRSPVRGAATAEALKAWMTSASRIRNPRRPVVFLEENANATLFLEIAIDQPQLSWKQAGEASGR